MEYLFYIIRSNILDILASATIVAIISSIINYISNKRLRKSYSVKRKLPSTKSIISFLSIGPDNSMDNQCFLFI